MRTFRCKCGNILFYDNNLCLACKSETGFCPECRTIVALLSGEDGNFRCSNSACGAVLVKCANYAEHGVCNRMILVPNPLGGPLCDCCRFNATIPDLTVPGNLEKWYRLEAAKRRLFYDLGQLGLPYGTAADGIEPPLSFDFKADVMPESTAWRDSANAEKVFTGHAAGLITINIREADDIERERLRVSLAEAHRTLIGHFRHESGHYYWEMLVKGKCEQECIQVFGDHNHPSYAEALEQYYKTGPQADWRAHHISAYASMHPWEDFAETWASYLDMVSALDTAEQMGFGGQSDPVHTDVAPMITRYQQLGVALNEITRSMGLLDVVPQVIVSPVAEKMRFIHELVLRGRAANRALQPAAETDEQETACDLSAAKKS